ncbi:hypothetical protein [Brevibacillus laterosporus]|uniref:hypothetical protein n=1 Tax=Brevibacillus laterosporus TaxID=1465 RepID=UPI00215BFC88|nr:hypothetical protein [Brevibacillus laterosporus]MCR8994652.1 hypothetical protein [Brevibacillus laterosporus]
MPRFGVKEVADVTFYNLLTGKPELFLDTLKLSNLESNAETVYANGGKGAPRLVGWDYGRTATFNVQEALLNPKAIAMQTGTQLEKKVEKIYKREFLVSVDDGSNNSKITLEQAPLAGSITLYETSDGYGHDKEVATASITVSGKAITIPSASLAVGKQVIVYYQYETTSDVEVLKIQSDKYSGFYRIVGDTFWRNQATLSDEKVQIVIPKAKIMSQFTLTMQPDGEPSVFDFNLDVFKDTNTTDMVKIVRY